MTKKKKKAKIQTDIYTHPKPTNLQSFLPVNRKGECEFLSPVGRCLLKGPSSSTSWGGSRRTKPAETRFLFFIQSQLPQPLPPGTILGKDKMKWTALGIVAILQAQFPITGKAGCFDGNELLETLCTYVWGGGREQRCGEEPMSPLNLALPKAMGSWTGKGLFL